MEKIDIHKTERAYELAQKNLLADERIAEDNRKVIVDFLEASAIGRTARRNAKVRTVGLRARLKNLYLLRAVALFYKEQSLKELEVEDVERLISALEANRLLGAGGKAYSEQTKANIKKTLITFLRWLLGVMPKDFCPANMHAVAGELTG